MCGYRGTHMTDYITYQIVKLIEDIQTNNCCYTESNVRYAVS